MQTIRITTSQNIDIDYEVAGVGERILGRLIDFGLFIVIFIAGAIFAGIIGNNFDSSAAFVVLIIIYAALYVFYDLICETWMNGQSVGKRVMKIKVISLDGARPSFSQYLLRWLFRIVDFTLTSGLCGLISVAVSDKSQRVGDMVAGTTLIKTKPRVLQNNLVFTPAPDNYEPVFKEVTLLNDRDITLIHEVISNYYKTGNNMLVYNMAQRLKEHLSVTIPKEMNGMQFLQTLVKDYSYIVAVNDQSVNG
jgi:uncharacterized RDD family membrane protein YckC